MIAFLVYGGQAGRFIENMKNNFEKNMKNIFEEYMKKYIWLKFRLI